jgi:hypothetical protein
MLLLTAGRLRPAEGNRQEHLAQTGRVSLHLQKKGAAGGGNNVTCAHLQIRFLALHVSDSLQNKSKAGTALITLVMCFCLLRTQTNMQRCEHERNPSPLASCAAQERPQQK